MTTVLVVCGTRPEAIKLAPVVHALRGRPGARAVLCATGQHRELLDATLAVFGLTPDADLNVMQPGQHLTDLLARLLAGLRGVIRDTKPDALLVQGDTTTAMAGALAGFQDRVPVGHVEAGLRTYDLAAPFPEEANRRVVGVLAARHFAPTPAARDNLLAERVPPENVWVTGNTVVDALRWVRDRLTPADRPAYLDPARRLVLLTAHRRESFGAPLRRALGAVRRLADAFPDIQVVYPVHPNPEVKAAVADTLAGHPRIVLTAPTDYRTTVWLMANAGLILTDSGGIQEEAPSLGRPVLVLREVSERPEGVRAGVVTLVGTDPDRILAESTRLLTDPAAHAAASRVTDVYGDGRAAERIADLTLAGRTALPEFTPAS
jgi:UDP-N-acetylglucosamine 2-epimerase (non-hydrolysing)